jgi:hypothetical protein
MSVQVCLAERTCRLKSSGELVFDVANIFADLEDLRLVGGKMAQQISTL